MPPRRGDDDDVLASTRDYMRRHGFAVHALAGLEKCLMSWSYRIVRYPDGTLALHEVYYEDGAPWTMTEDPISFVVEADEGVEGVIDSLEMALRDAHDRPVLDWSEIPGIKAEDFGS